MLAHARGVDVAAAQAHADLLLLAGAQQAVLEQELDLLADEDAAVHAVALLGAVVEVEELERHAQQLAELARHGAGLALVGAHERVVVEGAPVADADEQQRPVRAALGHAHVAVVVDRQEDVADALEGRQRVAQRRRVRRLHQEEGHAGPEEHDVRAVELVLREEVALQVPLHACCVSSTAGAGTQGHTLPRTQ